MNPEVDLPSQQSSSGDTSENKIKNSLYELNVKIDAIFAERLLNSKVRRWLGLGVASIAIVMPLYILYSLWERIMTNDMAFLSLKAIPQAVLISGSFLSFIIIYTVLINGMFQEEKANELSSTVKEIMESVRSLDKGGN